MNVLLLSTSDRGGAANACIQLHQGLLKIGVNSKVLVLQKTKDTIPEVYCFLELYKPRTFLKRIKKAPKVLLFKRRRKRKKKGRPIHEMFSFFESLHDITKHPLYEWAEVINIHWVANYLDYPSFFRKNTKPVIWTLHDMLLFTGGYHYAKNFPFDAYKDLIEENYQLKNKIFAQQKFQVVSPSKWLYNEAQNAREIYPLAEHKLIPYGINVDVFKPYSPIEEARAEFNLPTDKKIILFVAASVDSTRKGINYLLNAIKILPRKDFTLAIMGNNAEKLQLDPEQTHLLGYRSDPSEMARIYSAADLFVIPSTEDNLPNTVLESIACGTPVVGFDIGGIPDMIWPGKNGEICSEMGAEALAKSIRKALNTDYDRTWIRQNAVKRYGLTVQATEYKKLIESL